MAEKAIVNLEDLKHDRNSGDGGVGGTTLQSVLISSANGERIEGQKSNSSPSVSSSRSGDKEKKKCRSSSERRHKKPRFRSHDRHRHSRKRSHSSGRNFRSKDGSHRRHSHHSHRSRSRSRSRDRRRRRSTSRHRSRRSQSHRSHSREYTRAGASGRPRVLDHRTRVFSPPRWSRSPPSARLPGPEKRDVMPFTARHSPPPGANMHMTAEERDQRTVFILQIARDTRPRDLEKFFSSVGHVRDVRIITDLRTRRSKGICYVEFWDIESVSLALALNGEKLLGAPLMIQPTLAERSRAANACGTAGASLGFGPSVTGGPVKLYVGHLHPSITNEMLSRIFAAFGKLESAEVVTELNGTSRGYAYVTFRHGEDAQKAVEQLNGFDLAGRPLKVAAVNDDEVSVPGQRYLDMEDAHCRGVDIGPSGRMHLMAKLAEGSGLELPEDAKQYLALTGQVQQSKEKMTPSGSDLETSEGNGGLPDIPKIATPCFVLSNMFDFNREKGSEWPVEVRDDVIEECAKYGGVVHVYVDKTSIAGNVYVKCPSVVVAYNAVNGLHGRWFSGKVITANYVPLTSYSQLFPASLENNVPILSPSTIPQGYSM